MEELKRLKLDVSKQIPDVELAQKPFGVFQTPSVDVTIGRRRTEFSEEEKSTRATVVARMELQVSFTNSPPTILVLNPREFFYLE